jgi:hypothetical protein
MAVTSIDSFHRHLHTRGLASSTCERYVACVLRLLTFADVPADSVTSVMLRPNFHEVART